MQQTEIFQLHQCTGLAWSKALEIYEASFPAFEKQSIATLKLRIEKAEQELYLVSKNKNVVGIAFLYNLNEDYLLLDYLAIDSNFKSQGLGSLLFNFVKTLASDRCQTLIIEVDEPIDIISTDRVRFYKQNGALMVLNILYFLPPLAGKVPTRQNIMLIPKDENQDNVSKKEIINLINQLYNKVYSLSQKDKLYSSTLGSLSDHYILK